MNQILTLDALPEAIAVSKNGKYFAIHHNLNSSYDQKITLWSLPDAEFITEVASINKAAFNSICFTSHDNVLVYAIEAIFVLYDTKTRERGTVTWAPNVYWMRADTGNRLVTAGTDIQVWEILDSQNFEEVWKLPGYRNFYNTLSSGGKADISPDGKKLAVAGIETEQVLIYDIEENAVIQTLDGAPSQVYWISWSADLRYLAVIGANYQGVYIWNLETGERVLSDFYNSQTDSHYSFCFHPGGDYFATGSFGGYVSIERIMGGETVYFERLHHSRVWALAFTPDGKKLISGGYDHFVSILDLSDIILTQ